MEGKAKNWEELVQEYAEYKKQLLQSLDLAKLPKTAEKRKFKIDAGDYINSFTVHFTEDGRALRVEIEAIQKVDPNEEQINFYKKKLQEALEIGNYRAVEDLSHQLGKMTAQGS